MRRDITPIQHAKSITQDGLVGGEAFRKLREAARGTLETKP